MPEGDFEGRVRSSRRKHDRSQSAGLHIKSPLKEGTEDAIISRKVKSRKGVKDNEFEDDLMLRQPTHTVEKVKRKHRKRTQSTDELDPDTTALTKDESSSQKRLVEANLYINDKNKSLEKETKQSYSDALSSWQQSVESTEQQENSKEKTDIKEKRIKKKSNILDSEGQTVTMETATNVDKVRRRLKKKMKERLVEGTAVTDRVDGRTVEESERIEEDHVAQGNLGFEDGEDHEMERRTRRKTRKSHAQENDGYNDEEVENVVSTEEPKSEKQKTGKRRRKKLKESPAELIHRALEKKREDDGYVLCVVIHKADRLKTDLRINHPVVRIHVLDMDTGQYVKKCSSNRAATSYYENPETVDHILPLMTEPFDFKQQKSLVPTWEDVLIINEIYSYFLQRNQDDPKVIIFFEVLDFLSMNAIHKLKNTQKTERGWYQIAWAFLKLVGSNGSTNTDTKIRLQLFYPPKSYRRNATLAPEVPEVYHWWCSSSRLRYPSTLYVTVKGVRPKQDNGDGRSIFALQEEGGNTTFDELTDKIGRGGVNASDNDEDHVVWTKLPGQPNRIPNQLMSTLQAGRRGCFVVKFSNDGRKLACGCADKDNFSIYIFETLSSRCCCKCQSHFSIIYDICWSKDDKEILSASSDGTARSWDVLTSQCIKTYPHPCFVYAACYHPQRTNIVVTGGYDRLLRIWSNESDGINGKLIREMEGHTGFINTICFNPSGQFMFSGDSNGTILLWNTFEYKETKSKKKRSVTTDDVQKWVVSKTVQEPEIKDCIINSITLHPNGRKLLVHTRDNVTRMVDLRSVMTRYIGSSNFKEHVRSTLSTCGSFVFSGSEDGFVHVWDTETGELLKVYSDLGYSSAVSDLDFHPYDNIIAFCSFGDNHPVVLYQFNQTNNKDEPQHTGAKDDPARPSPPSTPLPSPTRTIGQTTTEISSSDTGTKERKTMADVASETLLLNKIKKKLDSVLESSSTSAKLHTSIAGSRTLSPDRSSHYPGPSDTIQRGMVSLSTWGSDFPDTLYDGTRSLSPGYTQTQAVQPGASFSNSLSPNQERSTVSETISGKGIGGVNVKAIYSFEARTEDELTFEVGEVISVLREADENWWFGEMMDGRQGYYPTSYVVLLDEKSKRKEKSGKHGKNKEKKQYTAVRTSEGEMKIISAPEDSDGDVMFTKRSRGDSRPPRHRPRDVDGTRSSAPVKTKSPRRLQEESQA